MNEAIEPLNPIAFQLGPLAVHWYGIIIGLGALLGLWIAMRESEKRGLQKDTFIDLVLFAIPIAIICARIYYVAFEWDYYAAHPEKSLRFGRAALPFMRINRRHFNGICVFESEKPFVLEACRYCRAQHFARPGDRPLGELHESGSARRGCQQSLFRKPAPA